MNERYMVLCDCGQGDPPEHEICSVCGDDWPDCSCVSPPKAAQTKPEAESVSQDASSLRGSLNPEGDGP